LIKEADLDGRDLNYEEFVKMVISKWLLLLYPKHIYDLNPVDKLKEFS
jgi:hypothetical protein